MADPNATPQVDELEALRQEDASLDSSLAELQSLQQESSQLDQALAGVDYLPTSDTVSKLTRQTQYDPTAEGVVSGISNVAEGIANLGDAYIKNYASLGPLGPFAAARDVAVEGAKQAYNDPIGTADVIGKTAMETAAYGAAYNLPVVGPFIAPAVSAVGGNFYQLARDSVLGRQPSTTLNQIAEDASSYSTMAALLSPTTYKLAAKWGRGLASLTGAEAFANKALETGKKVLYRVRGPSQSLIDEAEAQRIGSFIEAFGGNTANTNPSKQFISDLVDSEPQLVKYLDLDDLPDGYITLEQAASMTPEQRAMAKMGDPLPVLRDRVQGKVDHLGDIKSSAIEAVDASMEGNLFGVEDFDFAKIGRLRDSLRPDDPARAMLDRLMNQSRTTINNLSLSKPNISRLQAEQVAIENALQSQSYLDDAERMSGRLGPTSQREKDRLISRLEYVKDRLSSPRAGATAGEVWEEIQQIDKRRRELGAFDVGAGQRNLLDPSLDKVTPEMAALKELRSILKDGLKKKATGVSIGGKDAADVLSSSDDAISSLLDFKDLLDQTISHNRQQAIKIRQSGYLAANPTEVSGPVGEVKKGVVAQMFADRNNRIALASAIDKNVEVVNSARKILAAKKMGVPPPASSVSERILSESLPFANDIKEFVLDDRKRFALGWLLYHNGDVGSPFDVFDADKRSLADYADMLAARASDFFVGKKYASQGIDGKLKRSFPTYAQDFAAAQNEIASIPSVSERHKRSMALNVEGKPYGGRAVDLPEVALIEPTENNPQFNSPEPVEKKSELDTIAENMKD